MSADWSPEERRLRKGEPFSLVTMKTGTFASFDLSWSLSFLRAALLSSFGAAAGASRAASGAAYASSAPRPSRERSEPPPSRLVAASAAVAAPRIARRPCAADDCGAILELSCGSWGRSSASSAAQSAGWLLRK